MAKSGQRQNDARGQRSGRNNPTKSVPITAGTPKKRETYEQQAREHRDTDPEPQRANPEPSTTDHRREPTGTRAEHPRSGRSGSDSNASNSTRGG
jgi:hypothetical protein